MPGSNNTPKKYCYWYSPLKKRRGDGYTPMFNHCVILLNWAATTRNGLSASLTSIEEETGIPRKSVQWIIDDFFIRGQGSTISRVARSYNYDFKIYSSWNKSDKHKRRKKIIDAVKITDPDWERDY